ncbi:antirepressor [Paenibacillus macerans]|nr:antirepressor [Paenibacillus macerans]
MQNNELTLFEGHNVAILFPNDVNFQFVGDFIISAKDVASVLEYKGASATSEVLKFCKDKHIYIVKNSDMANRHIRKMNNAGEKFISNLSLNRVLGQSGQRKAIPFQDWLYEDMLPSVQKFGAYLTPAKIEEVLADPDTIITLATQLKNARKTIEEQKPLVTFAELCMQSDSSVKVRELAHSLSSHGFNIGQNKLFEKLREWNLICKGSTEPTQRAVEQGLFEIVTGVKQKPNGEPFTWRTPYATVKGQMYVADRLKKEKGA